MRLKKFVATIAIAIFAVQVVSAQSLTIHNNPQKAVYTSPAEWPVVPSQCHWQAPGIGPMPGMPAHTHLDLKFPDGAEMGSDPFTVPFTITMFHTNGHIRVITGGTKITNIEVDGFTKHAGDPQYYWSTPLPGDVNGVVVYTGRVTFAPGTGLESGTSTALHGYYPWSLSVRTRYDNGDELQTGTRRSVYSIIDPTAPEAKPGDGTGIRTFTNCQIFDHSSTDEKWSSNDIDFRQTLPILGPVSPGIPWVLQTFAYNYGNNQASLPPGTFEVRVDPDLHHDIPGSIVYTATGFASFPKLTLPDILSTPDGAHKVMFMWRRPTFDGTKVLTSILVVPVTIGPGGVPQPPNIVPLVSDPSLSSPPPTTCQDHIATNVGGPLPCTYPPPRCAGMVGETQDVLFGLVPFHVTVTSESCAATAIAF